MIFEVGFHNTFLQDFLCNDVELLAGYTQQNFIHELSHCHLTKIQPQTLSFDGKNHTCKREGRIPDAPQLSFVLSLHLLRHSTRMVDYERPPSKRGKGTNRILSPCCCWTTIAGGKWAIGRTLR